jgi:hydrogenase expression/formation protein HypD
MEVCGTHTVSIFRSGLRSLLPAGLSHLSGPGCPVCVTHDSEVAAFLELAGRDKTVLATFGDLLRVPGPDGRSLKHASAGGARVKVLYSPLDAVALAESCPEDQVVFLAVGFETTAPAVAAAVLAARRRGLGNFSVFCCHKLVPAALRALLEGGDSSPAVDAFLLPGHAAIVLGLEPFRFVADRHGLPAVISGFEPADILAALCLALDQLKRGRPRLVNAYGRAVDDGGAPAARGVMDSVFRVRDALWRGLGLVPRSGLALRDDFVEFDALRRFDLVPDETETVTGCCCGKILTGSLTPAECPLFGRACTPQNPVGPCMVAAEGSCAAWYHYPVSR